MFTITTLWLPVLSQSVLYKISEVGKLCTGFVWLSILSIPLPIIIFRVIRKFEIYGADWCSIALDVGKLVISIIMRNEQCR